MTDRLIAVTKLVKLHTLFVGTFLAAMVLRTPLHPLVKCCLRGKYTKPHSVSPLCSGQQNEQLQRLSVRYSDLGLNCRSVGLANIFCRCLRHGDRRLHVTKKRKRRQKLKQKQRKGRGFGGRRVSRLFVAQV
ncbi:unnamed protein product [Chondrus crispus]|uniref:Uncharacterized protein n=1 Tax=Chondrus crispus TaxID=2769 RepID=R7Q8P2_CHOCR|nr:unnamed protein product [Chondrus crispus]CDF34168.1 unnamed protein product [Chondrus crispus]|eukprot:XP_005713987.1 unnamed protein product [Chondrus crispus]